MPTTDSNGIIRYLDSDGAPTPPVLNLGMQSVSDAFSTIGQYYRIANTAGRAALVAQVGTVTPAKPLLVYRTDAREGFKFEISTDGDTWQPINRSGMSPNDNFFVQSGSVVQATNSAGQLRITFPTAFSTRINSMVVSPGHVAGDLGSVAIDEDFTTTKVASMRVRCYTPTGALVRSQNVRINWIATGY